MLPSRISSGREIVITREDGRLLQRHTAHSEFDISSVKTLPRVDIIYAYADMPGDLIDAAVERGAQGIVIAGVVLLNLLAGIALGVAWAILRLLRRRTRVSVTVDQRDGRYRAIIRGSVTFVGVPRVLGVLSSIPPGARVDVDLDVDMVDHAGFEALHAQCVTDNFEALAHRLELLDARFRVAPAARVDENEILQVVQRDDAGKHLLA